MSQCVDVVDGVLREAAVGREAVGAVALIDITVVLAVVQARGVHTLAATFAAAAAGVHFDGDAITHFVLVDALTKLHHSAHVFVAGGEVLVEGQAALDLCRWAMTDDFKVGGTNGDSIDTHQDLGCTGHWHRLVNKGKLVWVAENPCFHRFGNVVASLTQEGCVCGCVHRVSRV